MPKSQRSAKRAARERADDQCEVMVSSGYMWDPLLPVGPPPRSTTRCPARAAG